MKRAGLAILFAIVVLFAGGCCTSNKCIAITTANMMHDAGEVAAESLRFSCNSRYQATSSKAEIDALDVHCLPAARAYGSFRKAHAALVAVLVALQAGDPGAAVGAALKAAREAAADLSAAIAEVPR